MKYLLDGYNILFRDQGRHGSFEEQRIQLFEKLHEYAEALHLDLTLVLDAHLQVGVLQRHHFHSLEIIYTDFGQTADDCIIDYVQHTPVRQKNQLKVVTSDRRLMNKVRLEQVAALSITAFFKELEKKTQTRQTNKERTNQPKSCTHDEKDSLPPLRDTQSWIALFEARFKGLK